MRVLATIGFSFSAGVFLAALLPWNGWQLYAAGGVLLLALAWLFAARKQKYFRRGLLILLPLAVSLAYFAGYDHLVRQPIEDRCGAASDFAATVCDWPQATERGAKVTVELEGYHRARAVLYGEAELLAARPGDTVTGTAQWQSAVHFNSDDVTHFNARGVYALLYGREDVRLSAGDGDALRWLPQWAGKAFREKVAAIWDDPRVSGFLTAELTGDKSAMDDGDYLAMQETSLAHLFAVSGLHCAFLVTLLALLFVVMPSVQSFYQILSQLTVLLYLIMYMLMFSAAIVLRYKMKNTDRPFRLGKGNGLMWFLGCLGFCGALLAFVLSFVPPSQIATGSNTVWFSVLIIGCVVVVGAPFVIYSMRKPSWKDPEAAADFAPFHWEAQAKVAAPAAAASAQQKPGSNK